MTPLQSLLTDLLSAEDRDKLIGYGEIFLTHRKYLKANRQAERERENMIYKIDGEDYKINGVLDYAISKPSDVISLNVQHQAFSVTEHHKADEQTSYMVFIPSHKVPELLAAQMIGTRLSDCVSGMEAFRPLCDKLIITAVKSQDVTLFGGGKDCHLTIYCNHTDIPGVRELLHAS
jgi:hypothetical protein